MSSKAWNKIRAQLNGPDDDYEYETVMLGGQQGLMTPSEYEYRKAKVAYYGTTTETERPW